MLKRFKVSKKTFNLPILVISIAIFIGLIHLFSYMIPLTNNAFVATNVTPIAADVAGFITKLYIRNGEAVKKGAPLFQVYRKPYSLAYQYARARYEQGIEHIHVIEHQTKKTRALLKAAVFEYQRGKIAYQLKANSHVRQAVSVLEVKQLRYQFESLAHQRDALKRQIAVEDQQIVEQKKQVNALKASMNNAMVNLNLTLVRAPSDGIIDNMYISTGTPVKIHEPLFSFVDTATWWIQANVDETDLRRIRPGDEVYIILRMYYFRKLFHGRIVNTIWAANRQNTVQRTQQQHVTNENQWLLIPQRLPLQIEILDPDPHYPLQPGASAYVYLRAHTHP